MASMRAHFGPAYEGQRDEAPLKLTTFSYFSDKFLNKIVT